MAPSAAAPKSEGLAMTRVKRTKAAQIGTRKGPRYLTMATTGGTYSNAACADEADSLARELGFEPGTYDLAFGVNLQTSTIGIYIERTGADGAVPVKHNAGKRRSIRFHLGGVFEEYPELKPLTKVEVKVERAVDAAGEKYIMIPMKQATPKMSRPRKKKAESAATA
jgi:hypothetical protein